MPAESRSSRRTQLRALVRSVRIEQTHLERELDRTRSRIASLGRPGSHPSSAAIPAEWLALDEEMAACEAGLAQLAGVFARMTRRLRPAWRQFDLFDLMVPLIADLTARGADRGVIVRMRRAKELPRVFGDEVLLESLIEHALDGVMTTCEAGTTITVAVKTTGTNATRRLAVTIHDDGPTLSPEGLDAVRGAVVRAIEAAATSPPLVPRSVIEALVPETLASLSIDSAVGRGNRMTLRFPVAEAASALDAWGSWADTVADQTDAVVTARPLIQRATIVWRSEPSPSRPAKRSAAEMRLPPAKPSATGAIAPSDDAADRLPAIGRALQRLWRHERIAATLPAGSFVWYAGSDRWHVASVACPRQWDRRLARLAGGVGGRRPSAASGPEILRGVAVPLSDRADLNGWLEQGDRSPRLTTMRLETPCDGFR